eukprot:c31153_g1_i1 orf=3-212(-)
MIMNIKALREWQALGPPLCVAFHCPPYLSSPPPPPPSHTALLSENTPPHKRTLSVPCSMEWPPPHSDQPH